MTTRKLKAKPRTASNRKAGEGGGEIGRSLDTRYSGSVYLSDKERSTLKDASGSHNLSKAIQWLASVVGDIRRR